MNQPKSEEAQSEKAQYLELTKQALYAREKGDIDEIRRIRSEAFNIRAAQGKQEKDEFVLYLMACVEEADKQGLEGTADMLTQMVAIYSLSPRVLESATVSIFGFLQHLNSNLIVALRQIQAEAGYED